MSESVEHDGQRQVLVARVGEVACAILIASVTETMRPLPADPLGDAPEYVVGVAIVRGQPTIVVETARLLGLAKGGSPRRYVVVRTGAHPLALTFDEVIGVRRLSAMELSDLPPLLRRLTPDAMSKIGTADRHVMLLLESALVVPPELLARIRDTR